MSYYASTNFRTKSSNSYARLDEYSTSWKTEQSQNCFQATHDLLRVVVTSVQYLVIYKRNSELLRFTAMSY